MGWKSADGSRSLTAPLISKQSTRTIDTDDSDDTDTATVANEAGFPSLATAATALLVIGGMVTSVAAMAIAAGAATAASSSIAVYVMGVVCLVDSPWVASKQYQISRNASLRLLVNKLRDRVRLFQQEQQIMEAAVDDLEEEVECMHEIEQELVDMLDEQGYNVDEVVDLVDENESVLKKMKYNLRQVAMADIARIVITSDRNNDFSINLKEIKVLTLRIKFTLAEHGIDLDEGQFMAMVRKDNDVGQVLRVVGAIMFEDEKIDGKDFKDYLAESLKHEARQNELVPSLMLTSTIARLKRIAEDANAQDFDDEEADEMPMFMVQDRYTRGSVDVCRGSRVTLSKNTKGPRRTDQVMQRTTQRIKENPIFEHEIDSQNVRAMMRREGLERVGGRARNLSETPASLERAIGGRNFSEPF